MFDAILTIAYAIRDLYNDGFSLKRPNIGDLQFGKAHGGNANGELLLRYISKVIYVYSVIEYSN